MRRWLALALVALAIPGAAAWPQGRCGPLAGAQGSWRTSLRLEARLASDSASLADRIALAKAELGLGRPERAMGALSVSRVEDPEFVALLADVQHALGEHGRAGELYADAAAGAEGRRRGILAARAGLALERAGRTAEAGERYRSAAAELPPVAGWLRIREARVLGQPLRALELLRAAPPGAGQPAARARAAILIAAADTARATEALVRAGVPEAAAALALASGDTATARRLAFGALRSTDTAKVRVVLDSLGPVLSPADLGQWLTLARAYRRVGQAEKARDLAVRAVNVDSASAEALRVLGDLESNAGRLREALAAYAKAAEFGGEDGTVAEYRHALLLSRLGRLAEGNRALLAFAERHPTHPLAPRAVFLVAERRQGPAARIDSLYTVVASRWPRDATAGRARLALAARALGRGDTLLGADWYRSEIAVEGPSWRPAMYLLAELRAAEGESAAADSLRSVLSARDSLGYYGAAARAVLGAPVPVIAASGRDTVAAVLRATLERLDLLRASYLCEEAADFVAFLTEQDALGPDELLGLAEGLLERGWMAEGIRLGWRAADALTLNHTRVLRVIFPWPYRELVLREAQEHDLDPYLLAGLIRQESAFRPRVVSRAGAHGLMQLMPATAAWVAGREGIAWDERFLGVADVNVHVGATHFAALVRTYQGSEVAALAAYNAGGRPVRRWLRTLEAPGPFHFVEQIPYVETRGFVRSVLRNRDLYRALYPQPLAGDGTR